MNWMKFKSMASSSSSWWQSLFSPAKNAFTAHCFKRLQEYGVRILANSGFLGEAIGSGGTNLPRKRLPGEYSYGWVCTHGLVFLTAIKAKVKVMKSSQEDESLASVQELEKIIGYKFKKKFLLQQAFTHPSYQDSVSYERLEYVGDSILNFLISKQQFFAYPNLPPGSLTALRAANVDTEKLARVAVKYNFHKFLRHENPKLSKQIRVFTGALEKHPLHSYGLIDAPKILADIVESTIGAIYIDSNSSMDITWEVTKILLEPMITPEMLQTNPVRKLNELCHKNKLKVRFKDRWSQHGVYEVFVDNKLRGRGEYHAKKEIALNRAAKDACNNIINDINAKSNVAQS